MTYDELLKNRRSVRNYKPAPVPNAILHELINDSTLAPSASHGQPWQFIIVNDPAVMKRISDESKANILAAINADPDHYAARYRSWLEDPDFNAFWNAPSLVIILGDAGEANLHVDCALAASYFMFAAADRGLGTCWCNMGAVIRDPELRAELGLPESADIVAPIALGYPETIPPAPKRKPPVILKTIE